MDTIIDFVYKAVRGWSNATFTIIMGVIAFLGFYWLSIFLKANKKESAKVSKPSSLFMAMIAVAAIIVLTYLRY